MDQEEILLLVKKYNEGKCSPEEINLLETWYVNQGQLFHQEIDEVKMEQDLEDIARNLPKVQRKIVLWPRIAAAASIILCLSVGGYFILHKKAPEQTAYYKNDIKPGTNGAILTFANGQKVVLGQTKVGKITQQNGTDLRKASDSLLVYTANSTPSSLERTEGETYNTLETPKGKQYSVVLPDGSKVWLNAASTLKYPTAFIGKDRKVELTGEAYFEVVHNSAHPFSISAGGQTVQDIGTHFNINAYTDEKTVKTTLLEGSVRITTGTSNVLIKPGQQAILAENKLKIAPADVDDVIAWKEGMFRFTDESLESVMRKVSRWYDVEVVYTNDEVKGLSCNAIATRFSNVSKVLRMIELTKQVHFKIEGKKIIVMK
jgi:transmembrane sensor